MTTQYPSHFEEFGHIPIEEFDPFLPEYRYDPYPIYHYLHTVSPIHWSPKGFWILTRHSDALTCLKDSVHFSRKLHIDDNDKEFLKNLAHNPAREMQSHWLIFKDPPDHTRLRNLIDRTFTPRMVEKLRPRIQGIVNELLNNVYDLGKMDIIADFSYPLTIIVIAEMLGIPAEDRETFKQWLHILFNALDIINTPDTVKKGNETAVAFMEYFRDLVKERRKFPKDDLITALTTTQDQSNKLSEPELFATCTMLGVAGTETTMYVIANGILSLLHNPNDLRKLKENPSLIRSATEEILRYDSPAQFIARKVAKDTDIGDKKFLRGQDVKIVLGAVNRDPMQFDDPDSFDITRSKNNHVSFGHGIHFCLGAALTRVEVQIAINTLIQRMPNLRLQSEKLEWRNSPNARVLEALPVFF